MSRSLSSIQALLLGLVVLTGLVLGGYGLFTVGSRQMLFDGFNLQAKFRDAQRIEPGTRVYVRGMDAGEVQAVELAPGGVIMRLRLAERFRRHITEGSKAQIANDGLFTGRVIVIHPNLNGSSEVADNSVLDEQPGGDLMAEIKSDIKNEVKSVVDDLKNVFAKSKLTDTVGKLNSVLSEADVILKDFRKGNGPVGDVAQELKDATNKLNRAVVKADALLDDVQKGKGTFGKLVKNTEVYDELLQSIRDTRMMISSVKQNSDAIKSLPIVRSYVIDTNKILNRPDHKRYRIHFAESRLFQTGRAVLTAGGKRALNAAAQWLNDRKDAGSEIVVAAFADTKYNPGFAKTLTNKQSEAVANYLQNSHNVHRIGWWWWSNRTVTAVGCGNAPTPVPEPKPLPSARIELIVFVPEGS